MKRKGLGIIEFFIMCVLVLFMLIVSVIMPLASPSYTAHPLAFPLIAASFILPYVFFFIFGGRALRSQKRRK